MSLHDEHLKLALRHAPDSELAPDALIRETVLAYANAHLQASSDSKLSCLQKWFRFSHVANWQLASMASVAATLLIAVVLWQQRPDDTIWADALPTITSADLSKQATENKLAKAAPAEKALASLLPQESSPVSAARERETRQPQLAKRSEPSLARHDNDKLAIANAPHTGLLNVPPASTLSDTGAADLAKTIASSAVDSSTSLLAALRQNGGKVMASKDIQAGKLRLFKIHVQSIQAKNTCTEHSPRTPEVDKVSTYEIEVIEAYEASEQLQKLLHDEVEIYNETMLEWHANRER